MAELSLKGDLVLNGTLHLVAKGGRVKAGDAEVLVTTTSGQSGKHHGSDAIPVMLPPQKPATEGTNVWIFRSFASGITANGGDVVAQGMCMQGDPGKALWPGIVQQSTKNTGVKVGPLPINVVDDIGIMLPMGAPVTFTESRQANG